MTTETSPRCAGLETGPIYLDYNATTPVDPQVVEAAVLEACRGLQADGFRLTILPVDHLGRVNPTDLRGAITDSTTLVSIMLANAETGTLQPIAELARIAHAHGALFHTDAAQAAGKLPLDVNELGVDLLTVVGHKMYAPKGVGALYVRADTRMQPTTHGGGQEHGLHAGTENVALIAALGAASRITADSLPASARRRLADLRDRLHQRLTELLPKRVSLNGHPRNVCLGRSTSRSATPAARTY